MYDELTRLALDTFGDVVVHVEKLGRRASIPLKLRLYVRDCTLLMCGSVPTWRATRTIGNNVPNVA